MLVVFMIPLCWRDHICHVGDGSSENLYSLRIQLNFICLLKCCVTTGMPEKTSTQTASACLLTETCAKNYEVQAPAKSTFNNPLVGHAT